MDETQHSGAQVELISFEIAGQEFCIDIRSVREIRGWTQATPLPHTPSYVLGVINLRGAVMPVLDLRDRLGLGRTEASSRHVIVVVNHGERTAGLLVDAVQETFVAEEASMQRPPELEAAGEANFVDSILPLDGRMLSRLVVERLMPADTRAAA
ncbi:MAG: chemotaxis protein CheW [Phenylobacterium sp.]|jgi:purine-binding chemotaxis protein CheW|uniref:chemotaxis protein CheW n=1 Tax=Phenylobacterium sp. TaxID=1871053 RepID=UPI00391DC976